MPDVTDVDFGTAHHHLTRTEQQARSLFNLLADSRVGAPPANLPLAVWLERAFPLVDSLSGGQRVIWNAAMDVFNGTGRCELVDLMRLDRETRTAVVALLYHYWLGA